MAETTKPDLTYTCPNCGKHAVVGTHFCRTIPRDDPDREPRRRGGGSGGNQGLFILVAVAVAVLLLWRLVGPASLVLALAGFLGFQAWTYVQKIPSDAYQELVKICKGAETADRLVDAEVQRDPKLSKKNAARQALDRYRRDLGR